LTPLSPPNSDAEFERLLAVVAEFRRRLEAEPGSLFPAHADSLLRLGSLLAERGETAAAFDATSEAVELFRAMTEVDPNSFRLHLASALNALSNRLDEAGDRDRAGAACDEAVAEARQAVAARSDQARFVLVSCLINQAGKHLREGDSGRCLDVLAESVVKFRDGGVAGTPYLGTMIEALHRASMAFSEIGQWAEAIDVRRLMVGLFGDAQPPAMVHLLALTQHHASLAMAGENRTGDALAQANDSVDLARILYDKEPEEYQLFLAQTLGNQAGRRHQSGDTPGGLDAALEAVNLFHVVVERDPAAAVPSMILTLGNLSAILTSLDMAEQAAIVDEQRSQLQQTLDVLTGDRPA
jgi:tetratricopeptide (TPR) repeat protein